MRIVAIHEDDQEYKNILRTVKLWPRPYSDLTGQISLKQVSPWSTKKVECMCKYMVVSLKNRCRSAVSIVAVVKDQSQTICSTLYQTGCLAAVITSVMCGRTKQRQFGPVADIFTLGCTHFCLQQIRHLLLCVELF